MVIKFFNLKICKYFIIGEFLHNITAENTANVIRNFILSFGTCENFMLDNGREYNNNVVKSLSEHFGINVMYVIRYM